MPHEIDQHWEVLQNMRFRNSSQSTVQPGRSENWIYPTQFVQKNHWDIGHGGLLELQWSYHIPCYKQEKCEMMQLLRLLPAFQAKHGAAASDSKARVEKTQPS